MGTRPRYDRGNSLTLMRGKVVRGCTILGRGLRTGNYAFGDDASARILIRLVNCVRRRKGLSLLATIRLTLQRIVNTCTVTIISHGRPSRVVTTHGDDPLIIKMNRKRFFLTSSTAPVIACAGRIICLSSKRVTMLQTSTPLGVISLGGMRYPRRTRAMTLGVKRLRGKNFPRFVLGRVFSRPSYVDSYVHKHIGASAYAIALSTISGCGRRLLHTKHFVVMTYNAS